MCDVHGEKFYTDCAECSEYLICKTAANKAGNGNLSVGALQGRRPTWRKQRCIYTDPSSSCCTLEQNWGISPNPENLAIATNTAGCPELIK